jgi:hypothetical protein
MLDNKNNVVPDYAGTIILTEGSEDVLLILCLLENIYKSEVKDKESLSKQSTNQRISVKIDEDIFTIVTHSGYTNNIKQKYDQKYKATIDQIYKLIKENGIIDAILIIVDTDDNFVTRVASVQKLINEHIMQLPEAYVHGTKCKVKTIQNSLDIKTGYFILPNNKDEGSLEALLLEHVEQAEVEHANVLACVDRMLSCLENNVKIQSYLNTKNKKDKLKLRLYLDGLMSKYNLDYKKTYQNEIDFNHKCFDNLKYFLTK